MIHVLLGSEFPHTFPSREMSFSPNGSALPVPSPASQVVKVVIGWNLTQFEKARRTQQRGVNIPWHVDGALAACSALNVIDVQPPRLSHADALRCKPRRSTPPRRNLREPCWRFSVFLIPKISGNNKQSASLRIQTHQSPQSLKPEPCAKSVGTEGEATQSSSRGEKGLEAGSCTRKAGS